GKEVLAWEGPRTAVFAVAFAPDGRRAVSGGGDRAVRLWDVTSGNERHALGGHDSAVLAVAFAADGRRVFSAHGQGETPGQFLRAWDADSGKGLARQGGAARVWCVAFAADGSLALSGGTDKGLRVWPLGAARP